MKPFNAKTDTTPKSADRPPDARAPFEKRFAVAVALGFILAAFAAGGWAVAPPAPADASDISAEPATPAAATAITPAETAAPPAAADAPTAQSPAPAPAPPARPGKPRPRPGKPAPAPRAQPQSQTQPPPPPRPDTTPEQRLQDWRDADSRMLELSESLAALERRKHKLGTQMRDARGKFEPGAIDPSSVFARRELSQISSQMDQAAREERRLKEEIVGAALRLHAERDRLPNDLDARVKELKSRKPLAAEAKSELQRAELWSKALREKPGATPQILMRRIYGGKILNDGRRDNPPRRGPRNPMPPPDGGPAGAASGGPNADPDGPPPPLDGPPPPNGVGPMPGPPEIAELLRRVAELEEGQRRAAREIDELRKELRRLRKADAPEKDPRPAQPPPPRGRPGRSESR